MKKIYLLTLSLFLSTFVFAQAPLIFEDFQTDTVMAGLPTGWDTTWINADWDGLPDQSGANRKDFWFPAIAFADQDTLYNDSTYNVVYASNSWTLDAVNPVQNYLILPPIHLNAADGMLYWKNAPFQTPRYVDGLQVVVSTGNNFPESFTDTLRLYAEYIDGGPGADSSYSNYTFSSPGYIFGIDGQWIEYHGDSMRFRGVLRPDSASLAAYVGQTIYIAFVHGTTDDNLVSIDDIMVTGNYEISGVADKSVSNSLSVFPNPASDNFRVSYTNSSVGPVRLNLYDVTGKLVKSISNNYQIRGNYFFDVNTRDLANGMYNVVLENASGKSSVKLNIQR